MTTIEKAAADGAPAPAATLAALEAGLPDDDDAAVGPCGLNVQSCSRVGCVRN